MGKPPKHSGQTFTMSTLYFSNNVTSSGVRLFPPECFGGLPIPRVPSEIRENKVFSKDNRDITEEFLAGAEETLKVAKENEVNFVILKERSPSCGSTHIYDGSFSGNIIPGQGITAKRLTEEKIKVFSEENLEEIEKYLVELDKN